MDKTDKIKEEIPSCIEAEASAEDHIKFMKKALEYAALAEETLDVPVGAVVVCDGEFRTVITAGKGAKTRSATPRSRL